MVIPQSYLYRGLGCSGKCGVLIVYESCHFVLSPDSSVLPSFLSSLSPGDGALFQVVGVEGLYVHGHDVGADDSDAHAGRANHEAERGGGAEIAC